MVYYQSQRKEMRKFLPKNYNKILDIGCGEGNFTKNLNGVYEIWGIEPNTEAANIASKKMDKIIVGFYEDIYSQLPNNYFDVVICNDVIEHMKDPNYFMDSIKYKMAKESFIIGSIPNVRYYLNLKHLLIDKDWKYCNSGILDNTHLRFFTKKSIIRQFSNHKFTIKKINGLNKFKLNKKNLKSVISFLLMYMIIFATFGFNNDIKYLQFGFIAQKD